MDPLFFMAKTLDIVGKLMIAYTALMVHHRVLREHKIDKSVFRMMKREQAVGIAGVLLMVIAYAIEVFPTLYS